MKEPNSIEEIAADLYGEFYQLKASHIMFKSEDDVFKDTWRRVAKRVKQLMIEERIDEVFCGMTCDSERLDNIRIKDLKKELEIYGGAHGQVG